MSVYNRGTNIIIQADPSFSVKQAIAAADTAVAAASGISTPYPTRAAFLAATIPPVVTRTSFFVGDQTYAVVRDAAGPIEQADGTRWAPDGPHYAEHFGAVGDGVDNCEGTNFCYDWLTDTSYAVGDRVQAPSNRRGYVCLAPHTSGDFAADLAAGRWRIGQFFGTDDRPAFEAALQAGYAVTLMAGKRYVWREPAGNPDSPGTPFIDLTANRPDIHIIGAPDAWILMDEDVDQRLADGNGTASFGIDTGVMEAPERGKYGVCRFENLNVRSRWSHYPGTNLDAGPNGSGFNWCRIEGYSLFEVSGGTYEDFRQKVSRNRHNAKVRITNTNGFRLAKGMWREVNSSDVIATGNHIDGSGDDCLDFIYVEADGSNPNQGPGSFLVMSGNIVKNSENMQSQGFSQVTICDNVLDRMVTDAISLTVGDVSANERPRTALKVTGNIITNTLMPWDNAEGEIGVSDENSSIIVRGARRTRATTDAYPGAYDATAGEFILPYAYLQSVKRSEIVSSAGGFLIEVCNNQILQTLPAGVNYADWGYGWMFSPSGFVNPVVSKANFLTAGVGLANDINGAKVTGNQTLGIKYPVRLRETNSLDVQRAFDNILVDGNICIDCVQGFSHSRAGGATTYRWGITVSNNIFDCDPFFQSPNRTTPSDGSWVSGVSSLTGECGIQARNLPNLKHFGNTFRNCYTPVFSNTVGSPARNNVSGQNTVECFPVARSYDAGNKGIAIPCSGADFAHIIVDCDPTSETYGNVLNAPESAHSSRPASGVYVQGWFSRDTSGANLGWVRLTTGSGHVLGTDWRAI